MGLGQGRICHLPGNSAEGWGYFQGLVPFHPSQFQRGSMADENNRVLRKLLDRLYASLISGPSMNCRPHSSRQRFDLVQLSKLDDQSPDLTLRQLLGPERNSRIKANVAAPRERAASSIENNDDSI